jgi:hypothetical protein
VQLGALNAAVAGDLPRLNALLRARRLPEVRPEPQRPPATPPMPNRGEEEDEAEQ